MEPDRGDVRLVRESHTSLRPPAVAEIWQPVPADTLAGAVLTETLDGGQCFRWNRNAGGTWHGACGPMSAVVRETAGGLDAHLLAGTVTDLRRHLATDVDWRALADQLPWRTDAHLARCLAAFPGLRILRQPFGETLLCFLCSATKQVSQIKQMAELLAANFGREIAAGVHALPTWAELAGVSEGRLRACKLGFRARHVHAVAQFLAARTGWLEETAALPYADARTRLLTLSGVGEKIADCVLLFGAGRLQAFPVDVWVLRAMVRRYGLEGWSLAHVAHFGRAHFGPLAGLAQQFLFAWERRHGRRNATDGAVGVS